MQSNMIISYQESFPVELSYARLGNAVRHWHEYPQLFFILSGKPEFIVDNTRYCLEADDIILVNAHQIHEIQSEDSILLSMLFDISFFVNKGMDAEPPFFICNSQDYKEEAPYRKIKQLMAHLVKVNAAKDENNYLLNYSLMFHLVHELMSHFLADSSQTVDKVRENTSRLQMILDYLSKHYQDNISLTKAAEQVYLSPSYLSHYFEQNMGISFSRYLTNLRLEKSLIPLTRTNISIEELSDLCGFGNSRSYTRFFKNKYGILPSEYRKKYRNTNGMLPAATEKIDSEILKLEKSSVLEHLTAYLESPPAVFSENHQKLPSKKDALKVNVNKVTEVYFPSPSRVIHLGHIRNALSHSVQDMLTAVQNELGFNHIFFHSIFDDSMMFYQIDMDGQVHYNFDMIDEALDYLIGCKMKLIVQLSYMPRQLAQNPEHVLAMNQSIYSMPKVMDRWKNMVRAFLCHVQERYGLTQIRSWIFTTFLELPLPYVSQHDKMQEYYKLYRETWRAIKEYNPDFHVALPPVTCVPLLPHSFKELLAWCEKTDAFLIPTCWPGMGFKRRTRNRICPRFFQAVRHFGNTTIVNYP